MRLFLTVAFFALKINDKVTTHIMITRKTLLIPVLLSTFLLQITAACTPIAGGGTGAAPIIYGANATAPQSAQKAEEAKKEEDALTQWQDTDTKKKILEYLAKVTADEKSKDFIPKQNRIAVFDNDGTLWGEHPPVWALFTEWRIRTLSEYEPQMRSTRPYQTLLTQGATWLDNAPYEDMMELIAAASTGTSQSEFRAIAAEFFETKHPQLASYQRNVYPPMRELLALFEKHGFKNFIVTGGDVELVRAVSQKYYNIPPEQVIGSTWRVKPLVGKKDVTLYRENVVEIFTNKNLKPVMIDRHIGKVPVVAVGNDGGGGDIAMLKYSQSSGYPSLQLLIKHDDAIRETLYSDKDGQSLTTAKDNGWTVISIAKDWKEVFGKAEAK